jgi:hypothetical protein
VSDTEHGDVRLPDADHFAQHALGELYRAYDYRDGYRDDGGDSREREQAALCAIAYALLAIRAELAIARGMS